MFEIKKKWFFVGTVLLLLPTIIVNIDSILVWNLALIIISTIMLFFNQNIFNRWFKFVFAWLFPILFLMSMSAGSTGFGFDSTDYAYVDGWILGMVTIAFVLVQKFWYKR